jgi:hypothetical protein
MLQDVTVRINVTKTISRAHAYSLPDESVHVTDRIVGYFEVVILASEEWRQPA